jgi:hypothetical protein
MFWKRNMKTTNTLFEKIKRATAKHDVCVALLGACIFSFIGTFILLGLPGTLVGLPCYAVESLLIPGFKTPYSDSAWGLYLVISELWPFAVALAYLLTYKLLAKRLTNKNKMIAFCATVTALTFVVCDLRVIEQVSNAQCNIGRDDDVRYAEQHATSIRREGDRTIYLMDKGRTLTVYKDTKEK